jgi:hypothetical protein
MEVKRMVIMRPQNRNLERDKKIIWLRKLRERTQHLSIALRPQIVRTMWMTRCSHKVDASTLVKGTN